MMSTVLLITFCPTSRYKLSNLITCIILVVFSNDGRDCNLRDCCFHLGNSLSRKGRPENLVKCSVVFFINHHNS